MPRSSVASIFILGGHQTDFARNYAKEGPEISDIVRDAVEGTLADAHSTRSGSRRSMSATRSGSSSTARATSAACRRRSSRSSGACRQRDTRRRARPAASPCSRRRPRSRPAVTTARSCSAPSRSATFPAIRRRRLLGRGGLGGPRGRGREVHLAAHVQPARRRVRAPLRPRPTPPQPRSPSSTSATPSAIPMRRPAAGRTRPRASPPTT